MEQLELFYAYTVRLWVVVPNISPTTVAVGPCSHEVAWDHVQRWNTIQNAQRAARGYDLPGSTSYYIRPATPAEVAEVRAWETTLRYDRDRQLAAA